MTEHLDNTDTGVWRIRTATGSWYLLDLKLRTLTRLRSAAAPEPEFAGLEAAQLRRDGEQLDLHSVVACRVGERAVFVIQVGGDPSVVTVRDTSPVREIMALSGPSGGS